MKLKSFKKGIHPQGFKSYTEMKPLERLPLPEEVFIPLQQHIGAPCKPMVEKGQPVKTGELIGRGTGFISSRIHASISGKVKKIDSFPHPLGVNSQMIHIVGDGNDEWIDSAEKNDNWEELSSKKIVELVQEAGIVGMGGAAFPSYVKLSPPKSKKIDTFILNGCECEPYLTADHRMMVEQTDAVILGTRIIMKALGVSKAVIGIESNKPDAIEAVARGVAAYPGIVVTPLKVKYPQGAEKMLIKAAINREVPTGGLPLDVGVVVNNVGTAIAVAEAITMKKPLIERVVSITGDGIHEPKNVVARIGTPFQNIIDFCGGLAEETVKVIMGGPMMGITQHTLKVPVIKATSGILCLTESYVVKNKEYPCIQCGTCVDVCPMNLLPTRLARFAKIENWKMAEELGILNCIECGSCAFVCPSQIPLVQQIRVGKLKVNEKKQKEKLETVKS
jgi:electron transport complex protein RnfC